jgi:ParB family chromosome partitioning protein
LRLLPLKLWPQNIVARDPARSLLEENMEQPGEIFLANIADIVLGSCGREINKLKAKQLARSMSDQGQRNPIQIYKLFNGKFGLAAGQHRCEAAKILGWPRIPAVLIPREEAKAWRAAENLHRNELDKLRQSLAIVEYAAERKALPSVKMEVIKGGKQPRDKGYSRLAREIGFSRKRIMEAYAHAALPDSIKAAVFACPKSNKRSILNRLTGMETEREQLRVVRERSRLSPSMARGKTRNPKSANKNKPRAFNDNFRALLKRAKCVAALNKEWEASPFQKY